MRDLQGHKLADGEFSQTLTNGQLHVRIIYNFSGGRQIEERGVFRQQPHLVQERWAWRELRDGKVVREYEADFASGKATAQKLEDGKPKHWSEHLKIEPGRTFAGYGFSLALKEFRDPLLKGQKVELHAVAFSPKPRVMPVEVSYGGVDHMAMGGRDVKGERFIIHMKLPWVAKAFVTVPDTRLWLTIPPPASFLRWEGLLVEPGDPIIRVDRLPGEQSGPAEPVTR
jgi:hypothetical protein